MATTTNQAINKAKWIVKSNRRIARRDATLDAIVEAVSDTLLSAGIQAVKKEIDEIAFHTLAQKALKLGYKQAYTYGAADAGADFKWPRLTKSDDNSDEFDAATLALIDAQAADVADQRTSKQSKYVDGLYDSILSVYAAAETLDSLQSRFDLYGASAMPVYEQGYSFVALQVKSYMIWHALGDHLTCSLCADRDNQMYTEATLPGYPGDGGFGDLCEGGALCRCWLEYYEETTNTTSEE